MADQRAGTGASDAEAIGHKRAGGVAAERGAAQPWLASYPPGLDWAVDLPSVPVGHILENAGARFPNRPCLDFYGGEMSYAQVAREVAAVAAGLRRLGVKKGARVGIFLPNSPFFVIGYFAVLAAGGTVVALNPLHPEHELRRQVEEADVGIILTIDIKVLLRKVERIEAPGLRHVVVARMADALPRPQRWLFPILRRGDVAPIPPEDTFVPWRALAEGGPAFSDPGIDPGRDLAVILFTGGTTGRPKGVMLTHAALSANVEQCRIWFTGARPGQERVLAVLPFFHVFGMTAVMLFGLSLGGQLILLPRVAPHEILRTISRRKPTILSGVPRLFRGILEHPRRKRHDLSSLRLCVSGGDFLPPDLLARFTQETGRFLAEGFGLTETAGVAACNPFEGDNRAGAVGLPLPGTDLKIVDEDTGEALPAERIGEVLVRGPQLMAGYLNDPAATAEALRDGWLWSGDLGFLDTDGYLHIVDRRKDVIIVNGVKVYPRYVEDALHQHPDVTEAAVVAEGDDAHGWHPKAFVVPKEGTAPKADELHAFLADRLSRIEMPRHIEFRDSLPLSPIGKPLRRELRR